MTTPCETQKEQVPEFLENFRYEIHRQRFELIGGKQVLVLSMSRDFYNSQIKIDGRASPWVAMCRLSITVEPIDAAEQEGEYKPIPRCKFVQHLNSTEYGLKRVSIVCSNRHGIRMDLPNGEVDGIAIKERDRLLEIINQMRGIRLLYVHDSLGFLKNDGSDKQIVTELPFPQETCVA